MKYKVTSLVLVVVVLSVTNFTLVSNNNKLKKDISDKNILATQRIKKIAKLNKDKNDLTAKLTESKSEIQVRDSEIEILKSQINDSNNSLKKIKLPTDK